MSQRRFSFAISHESLLTKATKATKLTAKLARDRKVLTQIPVSSGTLLTIRQRRCILLYREKKEALLVFFLFFFFFICARKSLLCVKGKRTEENKERDTPFLDTALPSRLPLSLKK